MVDWGVPDWREADAYPAVEETTRRVWWWEFLRRRPDYRELWAAAQESDYPDHRYAPDVDAFRLQFELSVIYDPRLSFTDFELFERRYPVNAVRFQSAAQVEPLPSNHPGHAVEHERRRHSGELAEKRGLVSFTFDLSKPLPAQFARAEFQLHVMQSELFPGVPSPRDRRSEWPTFLRVIDARDARATFAEISATLWPSQEKTPQSARDKYEAACLLRDNFPI